MDYTSGRHGNRDIVPGEAVRVVSFECNVGPFCISAGKRFCGASNFRLEQVTVNGAVNGGGVYPKRRKLFLIIDDLPLAGCCTVNIHAVNALNYRDGWFYHLFGQGVYVRRTCVTVHLQAQDGCTCLV